MKNLVTKYILKNSFLVNIPLLLDKFIMSNYELTYVTLRYSSNCKSLIFIKCIKFINMICKRISLFNQTKTTGNLTFPDFNRSIVRFKT